VNDELLAQALAAFGTDLRYAIAMCWAARGLKPRPRPERPAHGCSQPGCDQPRAGRWWCAVHRRERDREREREYEAARWERRRAEREAAGEVLRARRGQAVGRRHVKVSGAAQTLSAVHSR
jgi:hypothetical protein